MKSNYFAACALAHLFACITGCSEPPEEPEVVVDYGYTLRGTVIDGATGTPLSGVEIWLGFPSLGDAGEFQRIDITDGSGTFRYDALGPVRPSSEVFRFIKEGYRTIERDGATAEQVGFAFRLDVVLEPLS